MKKFFYLSIISYLFNPLVYAQDAETLTLITYYPAPYGVYNTLRFSGELSRLNSTLYGTNRNTHINIGVSSTTGADGQNYFYCTVSGGYSNTAGGANSTVGGGQVNAAGGSYSTIGGGYSNLAVGNSATIGGGNDNTISESSLDGDTITGHYATIGGGRENIATGWGSTVGGGYKNKVHNYCATVSGGSENFANDYYTTIGGGVKNEATNHSATVAGGDSNRASGWKSTIGGGYDNTASNNHTTVGGGWKNKATGDKATVCGGYGNLATGDWSIVAGGRENIASHKYSTVVGGENNKASKDYAFVGGGQYNWATDFASTIGGGTYNRANNDYATVGGGESNEANGQYATVPGGWDNEAKGNYSFAAGRDASAKHDGCFVWADSSGFLRESTSNNQFRIWAGGGVYFASTLKWSDIAEFMDVLRVEEVKEGEIVSLKGYDRLGRSSRPYDEDIIGVVSSDRTFTLHLGDETQTYPDTEKHPITLAGRVFVKVNSENGPIKIGDPITSSSTPGIGMKATKTGRVIGYAMEDLNDTEGEILVFVNLTYYIPPGEYEKMKSRVDNLEKRIFLLEKVVKR